MKKQDSMKTLQPTELRVCGLISPMGIDGDISFSWLNSGNGYGRGQSAYRILVSSTLEKAESLQGDLWDTGKILAEKNCDISYRGKPLASRKRYYFRVAVWDEKDEMGNFSQISHFETGILSGEEWLGEWIGPDREAPYEAAPLIRKSFLVEEGLVSSRLYLCGLGLYLLKVNGKLCDTSVLNPAHTQYEDRVHYQVYDLAEVVTVGKNLISLELGDGFYHNDVGVWNWQNAVWRDLPKLRAMLFLRYADGREERVVSGSDWLIHTDGPTRVNNILLGDLYDARREVEGWEEPDFDDSAWQSASLVPPPTGKLVFGAMEPMRRLKTFKPTVKKLGERVYLIENPEMTTGWARISFDAPSGEEIVITYGEQLLPDGTLKKPTDFGISFQIDRYIAKGVKGEVYEPKFGYRGYRYIQVENYSGKLSEKDVTCYLVANDLEKTSVLKTGDPLVNRLHEAMSRTILNNCQGKPTDTPVWEKNGWTGDFHVSLESVNFNYGAAAFTMKFLHDLEDAADSDGAIPVIAPTANWGLGNQVVWNGVFVNAVYELYRYYGMTSAIHRFYPAMARLVATYLADMGERDFTWCDSQLCDWVSPFGGSDPDAPTAADASEGAGICGTGYVYLILCRMVEMARITGREEDAIFYENTAKRVYAAFNEKYYDPEKGYYETTVWREGTRRTRYRQTSNLVPLAFGLCPEAYRQGVVERLVRDIEEKDYHLDVGMVGTKLILPVLSESGYHDLAYRILTRETYPSWGYWIKWGADTTWEGYENTARSHNHYFLGTYDEWLYRYLAGVRSFTDGFRAVELFPRVVKALGWLECRLKTVRGILVSSWRVEAEGGLSLVFEIPVGTVARALLPCRDVASLTVNGKMPSADALSFEKGRVTLTLSSGSYEIKIAPDGASFG